MSESKFSFNNNRGTKKRLFLFDVDGTLTPARALIKDDMKDFLTQLRENEWVGVVGGSDCGKIREQIGEELFGSFDFVFGENGLERYKGGKPWGVTSIKEKLGEDNIKEFVNFCLHYIADLDIPVKRGTFIEFRNGMMNVSPIGRNCSREERAAFFEMDKKEKIRPAMVETLLERFGEKMGLDIVIGGQISFDVFPKGWDKRFCLPFIEKEFDEIHFFGDHCKEGGNDHAIYVDDRTIGHEVVIYQDTIEGVKAVIEKK